MSVKVTLNTLIEGVKTPISPLTSADQVMLEDGAHVEQKLTEIMAIASGATVTRIVATIDGRDALADLKTGLQVWVVDATADTSVSRGGAKYLYNAAGNHGTGEWIKTAETESMDMIIQWSVLQNVPQVLRELGTNAQGQLTLGGVVVSDGLVDVAIVAAGGSAPANLREGGLIIERT